MIDQDFLDASTKASWMEIIQWLSRCLRRLQTTLMKKPRSRWQKRYVHIILPCNTQHTFA